MTLDDQDVHLTSPYTDTGYQYKVQLHAHTTRSDGSHDPQWVMQAYGKIGYAAVAITDHDYRERTTPTLDDPGGHAIVHIPGVEYSANAADGSWRHMLGILIGSIHHADGWDARQSQIHRTSAEAGLSFLCHPYGEQVHPRGWTTDACLDLQGYSGMEIYNGASCGQAEILACFEPAVDRMLVSGRRLLLIATDDFHTDMDLGYVVINSPAPPQALVLDDVARALRDGNFFAVGRMDPEAALAPHFTDIRVEGRTLTVTVDQPADIEFVTARHHAASAGGTCSQRDTGVSGACYTVVPQDRFVRVRGTVNHGGHEAHAWSNPIYVQAR